MVAREEQSAELGLPEYQIADLRRIGEAYEADIGAIPSSAMEGFREYYLERGISADVVIKAIQAAAENNARRWPYIRSILERCVTEQVLTLEDWRQTELRKQSRKSGGNSGKGQAGHGSSYDIEEIEKMIAKGII